MWCLSVYQLMNLISMFPTPLTVHNAPNDFYSVSFVICRQTKDLNADIHWTKGFIFSLEITKRQMNKWLIDFVKPLSFYQWFEVGKIMNCTKSNTFQSQNWCYSIAFFNTDDTHGKNKDKFDDLISFRVLSWI